MLENGACGVSPNIKSIGPTSFSQGFIISAAYDAPQKAVTVGRHELKGGQYRTLTRHQPFLRQQSRSPCRYAGNRNHGWMYAETVSPSWSVPRLAHPRLCYGLTRGILQPTASDRYTA